MTLVVDVVGTETFYDNYGASKRDSIKNYAEDVWKDEIEDGSGMYEASFTSIDSSQIEISKWWLCNDDGTSCDSIWHRAGDADDYLQEHHSFYDSADVIIVADYMEDPNNNYHWGGAQDKAGTSTNKVAIIDVGQIEGTNGAWDSEESEGVTAHELMHMFIDQSDKEHYPHITSVGSASLSWDSGEIAEECDYSDRSANGVAKFVSDCTKSRVRSFIESNM